MQRHANSFGQAADVYDRARPSYPQDAVDWMLQSNPRDVIDLGAGTGKFTRQIADRAHALKGHIIAIDPDAQMLAKLAGSGIETLVGTGERIPVDDATADLVTCAQAWHWVDEELAAPEVARVLRPDGWLAIVWNARDDRVDWVARMSEIIHDSPAEEIAEHPPKLGPSFGPVESFETTWTMEVTRAALDELVSSRSYFLVASPTDQQLTLANFNRMLDAHPETAGREVLELPYRTFCYRARRLWTRQTVPN
jgi:ubiquinone/menaquinone biosynthesis C-methylase UbiE